MPQHNLCSAVAVRMTDSLTQETLKMHVALKVSHRSNPSSHRYHLCTAPSMRISRNSHVISDERFQRFVSILQGETPEADHAQLNRDQEKLFMPESLGQKLKTARTSRSASGNCTPALIHAQGKALLASVAPSCHSTCNLYSFKCTSFGTHLPVHDISLIHFPAACSLARQETLQIYQWYCTQSKCRYHVRS